MSYFNELRDFEELGDSKEFDFERDDDELELDQFTNDFEDDDFIM